MSLKFNRQEGTSPVQNVEEIEFDLPVATAEEKRPDQFKISEPTLIFGNQLELQSENLEDGQISLERSDVTIAMAAKKPDEKENQVVEKSACTAEPADELKTTVSTREEPPATSTTTNDLGEKSVSTAENVDEQKTTVAIDNEPKATATINKFGEKSASAAEREDEQKTTVSTREEPPATSTTTNDLGDKSASTAENVDTALAVRNEPPAKTITNGAIENQTVTEASPSSSNGSNFLKRKLSSMISLLSDSEEELCHGFSKVNRK